MSQMRDYRLREADLIMRRRKKTPHHRFQLHTQGQAEDSEGSRDLTHIDGQF